MLDLTLYFFNEHGDCLEFLSRLENPNQQLFLCHWLFYHYYVSIVCEYCIALPESLPYIMT